MHEDLEVWLDATVYEIFILPTASYNEVITTCNLSLRDSYLDELDSSGSHNIDDVWFHLQSTSNYFQLANTNGSHLENNELHVFRIKLLSVSHDSIPLNDYRMKLEVTIGDIHLTSSDIIIHVVEPLPALPIPGT